MSTPELYRYAWESFVSERLLKLTDYNRRLLENKIHSCIGVCNTYRAILHQYPNVVGTGVSLKVRDNEVLNEPCIVVFVERKIKPRELLPRAIPPSVGGIPTDVVEVGRPVLRHFTGRVRPAQPGYSIGHKAVTAGTFGCLVYDRITKERLILSNNHVIADSNRANIGDSIIQPGCYSEDTRILTDKGFKHFYELTYDDKIATLNMNGELEYQKPLIIHRYRYKGRMIHFRGQMYDLLVTPNHNMYVKFPYYKGSFKLIEAEKLLDVREGYIELKRDAKWNCEDKQIFILSVIGDEELKRSDAKAIPMDAWLEFLGWWLSEGSVYYKKGGYSIHIRQADERNLEEIANVIERMGFKPHVQRGHSVYFYSKQLFKYLKGLGHAENKFIPPELKSLPPHKLSILLKTLFKGDGSFVSIHENVKPKNVGKPRRYRTTSKRLAEDVAEVALKCGYGISLSKGESRYSVGISYRNLTPRITKKPRVIDYDGYVYCVTVPNHVIFVERNGKTCWCGNSYDGGCDPIDTIATLVRFKYVVPRGNVADAAVARPIRPDLVRPEIAANVGVPTGVGRVDRVGIYVQKVGRTTQRTYGIVTAYNASIYPLNWPGLGGVEFIRCIVTTGMSKGGDSGSLLLDYNRRALGLLFAAMEIEGRDAVTYYNDI